KQDHQAVVFALLADAPLPKKLIGDILDRFAIQGVQQYDGYLDAGGAFDAAAIILQSIGTALIQNVCEVADVALRLELRGIESPHSLLGKRTKGERGSRQREP